MTARSPDHPSRPDVSGRLCGFLNLKKRGGMTSRDVVDLVAKPLKRARVKVGHAGTLDPLATGVLVVGVGPATRLIDYVQQHSKTYRATIRLGATSDTLDADGRIDPVVAPRIPSAAEVEAVLGGQVGTILQTPPEYSALKVRGQRAYDLARRGESPDLVPRPVRIDRIDLLAYSWPVLEIEVDCGAGTYVRSIARDVGASLGCGGLIETLSRTRIGPFRIEDAVELGTAPLTIEAITELLRPATEAVPDLPRVALDGPQVDRVRRGQTIDPPEHRSLASPTRREQEVALLGPDGCLVAIAEVLSGSRLQPRRVL